MIVHIAAAAAFLSAPTASSPADLAPTCSSAHPADALQGRWTGIFAASEWTLEFTRGRDGWSGRYSSSRSKTWHDLLDLKVSGGCVSFAIASQPQLTFRLSLEGDAPSLTGDIDIAGHLSLPFTATRDAQ